MERFRVFVSYQHDRAWIGPSAFLDRCCFSESSFRDSSRLSFLLPKRYWKDAPEYNGLDIERYVENVNELIRWSYSQHAHKWQS